VTSEITKVSFIMGDQIGCYFWYT